MATKAPAKKKATSTNSTGSIPVIKPRSLKDLYVFGQEVTFDDGTDDPLKVWVQKLSPAEEKDALTPSRAKRSVVLLLKRKGSDDPEVLDYIFMLETYGLTDRRSKSFLVLQDRLEEERASVEERVSFEEKWSKDDYLKGLQDAWAEELAEKYQLDPTDEEASRVFEELKVHLAEVEKEYIPIQEDLVNELDHLSDDELDLKAAHALMEAEATAAMIEEFRFQKLFYATRDAENHSVRYFDSVRDVKELQSQVFEKLESVYDDISMGVMEGKD